ncbi:MAG TPA: hypothetical protein VMB03_19310 [Bryobacteraceae bacterium]|nr:hypothetical protein [Bryobacteraceae bacterium]
MSLSLLRRGLGYFHKYENRTYDRYWETFPKAMAVSVNRVMH